jgi:hypothetical protein
MSNPWSKFFWQDWETDARLKLCSLSAQGLWMRMLCIAAQHDPIGYVAVAGIGLDETAIARLTGASESEVQSLLGELTRTGVFSRDAKGRIYSRRMIRDARKAAAARKNGKLGGNPSLSKQSINQAWDNPSDKGGDKPQSQKPYARKKERKNPPTPRAGGGDVPAWIPSDEWRGYLAMRAKIRKPLTDRALDMAVRKLEQLRDDGFSPAAVLDQSTLHCWQDLYPIRASERVREGEDNRAC